MKSKRVILQGRSVKTLTVAELDELLALACVTSDEIGPSDGRDEEEDGPSMHPKHKMFYQPATTGEFERCEKVIFTIWQKGEEDWSSTECWIEAGEIWLGWGPADVLPIVKWFLDHGWSWGELAP